MPQLRTIEIFNTPVSLAVEPIVPNAPHAMTKDHCIVQLGLWCTESLPTGPGKSPGGNQAAKSPENSGNTAFYDAKNFPENHSCYTFSPMVLTQIHRKSYCVMYPG